MPTFLKSSRSAFLCSSGARLYVSAGALEALKYFCFLCTLVVLCLCVLVCVVALVVCFMFPGLVTFRSDWASCQWRIRSRRAHGLCSGRARGTTHFLSHNRCSRALQKRSNGCGRLTGSGRGPMLTLLHGLKRLSVAHWLLRLVLSAPLVTHLGCFAGPRLAGPPLRRVAREHVGPRLPCERNCPHESGRSLQLGRPGVLNSVLAVSTMPRLEPLLSVQSNAPSALQNVRCVAHQDM